MNVSLDKTPRATSARGSRGLIGWEVRFPGGSGPAGGEELELTDPDGVRIRVAREPS